MNSNLIKKSIYIETSVISYLTAKSNRDLIITARQQITRNWWEDITKKFESYISTYVIDEISQGDTLASKSRLQAIDGLNILQASVEIERLSKLYLKKMRIPDHAIYDCLHLACGVLNGVDIIVSWNFKHIANPNIRHILREINTKLGY